MSAPLTANIGPIGRAASRRTGEVAASFEFFPPKSEKMEESLWQAVQRLTPLGPRFVSVTYGAGGSTRERTHETVARMARETEVAPAAHLTCVGASRDEVNAVMRDYWEAGVRHIVALRGDSPEGPGTPYTPHPEGYDNGADLTAGAKKIADFEVSVGCYPEKHPDSVSLQADLDMLKRKIDAGADRAITQFFFDNDVFYRYMDAVRGAGIDLPIVPGIMPVGSFKGLVRMSEACQATVPEWMRRLFEGVDGDPETRKLLAASVVAEQCADLVENGFTQLHFYTLNKADIVYSACRILGLRDEVRSA